MEEIKKELAELKQINKAILEILFYQNTKKANPNIEKNKENKEKEKVRYDRCKGRK